MRRGLRVLLLGQRRARLRAVRLTRNRRPAPGPVIVAGLLRSVSGLGRGARLHVSAIGELGLPVRRIDLSAQFGHGDFEEAIGDPPAPNAGGTVIVHLNPPELAAGLAGIGRQYGSEVLRNKRLIGFWNWELAQLPAEWLEGFAFLDEVWVASQFNGDAVRAHSSLPVRVVPFPLGVPVVSGRERSGFGLPEETFVCLVMFDVWSSLARKNPHAALEAFRRAFAGDPGALLVVKLTHADGGHPLIQEFLDLLRDTPNVRVMREHLSQPDAAALIAACDCVISLHRSEGTGLVPAEAMLLGKPVVATGWSGNTDFMNEQNAALVRHELIPVHDPQGVYDAPGQVWADPHIDHAAEWLQRLARDQALAKRIGEAARTSAMRHFSLERFRQNTGLVFVRERKFGGFEVVKDSR